MPENNAQTYAVNNNNQNNNGTEPPSTFQKIIGFVGRMITIWMIINFFKGGNKAKNTSTNTETSGTVSSNGYNARCTYQFGEKYNLFVYVTENEAYHPRDITYFNSKISGLTFGSWDDPEIEPIQKKINFPKSVTDNNGTLWVHTYMTLPHISEPYDADIMKSAYRNYLLTPYKRLVKHKRTANLLTGKTEKTEEQILENPKNAPIVGHFHRNLTLNIVYDVTPFVQKTLVPPLTEFLKFSADGKFYEPTVFYNNYWNLHKDYTPINSTLTSHEFHLTIFPVSMFKFQLYASQMVQKSWMKNLIGEEAAGGDGDQDTLKQMLLDTNPILVGTTFVVSILHMIFEFLAFKNDIQFWNSKKEGKNLEGLSIRSVISSIVQSLIVFLYILDNDANWMIIFNIFIGMLIDIWKIKKVLHIFKTGSEASTATNSIQTGTTSNTEDTNIQNTVNEEETTDSTLRLRKNALDTDKATIINDTKSENIEKEVNSGQEEETKTEKPAPWKLEVAGYTIQEYAAYRESPTKKYDRMAFKYLGYILIPLFIGYGIYSIIYNEHKSWYSFVLGMCYGFLLVFGFIMMTPQLFINYKMKSVAHLPWRMLTYKFINTFIDDLFAFVIKMPTLYRIGCFRDDIVFLIFLYQKWIYKVDYSRVNEFGSTGKDHLKRDDENKEIKDKLENVNKEIGDEAENKKEL